MIEIFRKEELGNANYGWLRPRYHFSFASYYNLRKRGHGSLRVLNDDMIMPNSGFDTHPHKNMEIITYIIDGELTHQDSMGNKRSLSRGQVQYMSAGTGVYHSEYNNTNDKLRLLQIWIIPGENDVEPNYGDKLYTLEDRLNKQFLIVSNDDNDGDIKIHQNAKIVVGEYQKDEEIIIDIEDYDHLYFVQIEGESVVNSDTLTLGDAFHSTVSVAMKLKEGSHFLYIRTNDI